MDVVSAPVFEEEAFKVGTAMVMSRFSVHSPGIQWSMAVLNEAIMCQNGAG